MKSQQVYKKMLHSTSHQGNADKKHNEMPSHAYKNGHYEKDER